MRVFTFVCLLSVLFSSHSFAGSSSDVLCDYASSGKLGQKWMKEYKAKFASRDDFTRTAHAQQIMQDTYLWALGLVRAKFSTDEIDLIQKMTGRDGICHYLNELEKNTCDNLMDNLEQYSQEVSDKISWEKDDWGVDNDRYLKIYRNTRGIIVVQQLWDGVTDKYSISLHEISSAPKRIIFNSIFPTVDEYMQKKLYELGCSNNSKS